MLYEESAQKPIIRADRFSDFADLKNRVVYKLVNHEKNKELLESVPHLDYLDLAMVFYLTMGSSQEGEITVLIMEGHLKQWGVDRNEIYRLAVKNTEQIYPCTIKSMRQVLKEMFKNSFRKSWLLIWSFCPLVFMRYC